MSAIFHTCLTDEDFAQASLFVLAHKRDLHPSYSTMEVITLLYSYLTQGNMITVKDAEERIIGVGAYYYGTPDQEFKDRDVALLDMAIIDSVHRRTRLFVQGLQYMVNSIIEGHPEVQEIRLAAMSENEYLCRLYGKFAKACNIREGTHGEETVFCEKINTLRDTLMKFHKV